MRKIIMLTLCALLMLACTLTAQTPAQAHETQTPTGTRAAIKPAPTFEANPPACIVTATETLNLRAAPGTSAAVIGILRHGDLLTILPDPAQGNWIRVRVGDVAGWINQSFCERKP